MVCGQKKGVRTQNKRLIWPRSDHWPDLAREKCKREEGVAGGFVERRLDGRRDETILLC